jgi:hypothetical protein
VITGNATNAITEKIQLIEPNGSGRADHTLDLITPGAAELRLFVQDKITPGGGLLIRASNLGGKERVIVGDTAAYGSEIVPVSILAPISPWERIPSSFMIPRPMLAALSDSGR